MAKEKSLFTAGFITAIVLLLIFGGLLSFFYDVGKTKGNVELLFEEFEALKELRLNDNYQMGGEIQRLEDRIDDLEDGLMFWNCNGLLKSWISMEEFESGKCEWIQMKEIGS